MKYWNYKFNTGTSPLDVQLTAVLVARSIAASAEGSRCLVESDVLKILIDLLRAQQEDDEFVLQVYIFFRFYV